jgi:hypothetical protein
MRCMGCAAIALVGLAATGCAGLTDYPALANEGAYAPPGHYAEPPGIASGYYGRPYYAAPYSYPPAYVHPYPYRGPWGRSEWEAHEWRERRERAFQNAGHPPFGQPHPDSAARMPSHLANPVPATPPRPMTPPAAAPPQAAQNKTLLDQLGFRPNR